MNSVRETRKKHAGRLKELIANLESVQSTTAAQLEAARLAWENLNEPVRQLDECEMFIHTFQPRGYQEADCSACGETVKWDTGDKFCCKCGSSVVKAEKNYDPRERVERVAIRDAVQQIGGR